MPYFNNNKIKNAHIQAIIKHQEMIVGILVIDCFTYMTYSPFMLLVSCVFFSVFWTF